MCARKRKGTRVRPWSRDPRFSLPNSRRGGSRGGGYARSIPAWCPADVDHPASGLRKFIHLTHLLRRERKVKNRHVFGQSLDLGCARNDNRALLDKPAERHLPCSLAMRLANAREHLVAGGPPTRDRTIGRHRDAVLRAGGAHLLFVEIRVPLDLVGDD